jgi:hypothetical protein
MTLILLQHCHRGVLHPEVTGSAHNLDGAISMPDARCQDIERQCRMAPSGVQRA